jgi:hypothetical protein
MRRRCHLMTDRRPTRPLDQIEWQLEELGDAGHRGRDLAGCGQDRGRSRAFTRKRPTRKPVPEHLPRERRIVPIRRGELRRKGTASSPSPKMGSRGSGILLRSREWSGGTAADQSH